MKLNSGISEIYIKNIWLYPFNNRNISKFKLSVKVTHAPLSSDLFNYGSAKNNTTKLCVKKYFETELSDLI